MEYLIELLHNVDPVLIVCFAILIIFMNRLRDKINDMSSDIRSLKEGVVYIDTFQGFIKRFEDLKGIVGNNTSRLNSITNSKK